MTGRRRTAGESVRATAPAPSRGRWVASFLAIQLVIVTALILWGASLVLTNTSTPDSAARNQANADAVRRLYAAINAAVETGTTADLDPLLAPAFVAREPLLGSATTQGDLKQALIRLHATDPSLRIVPEQVVAGEETVVAVVAVRQGDQAGFMGVPEDTSALWGAIDVWRLVDGTIVEHRRGGAATASGSRLLRPTRLGPLPPATTEIALVRVSLAPGATLDGLRGSGPTIYLAEAGIVSIDHGSPGDGTGGPTRITRDAAEGVLVPAGVPHAIFHRGATPAVVLAATTRRPDRGQDGQATSEAQSPTDRLFGPPEGGAEPTGLAPGVTSRPLASGAVPRWPAAPLVASLGRVTIDRGGAIDLPAQGWRLLAVETGTATLESDPPNAGDAGATRSPPTTGGGWLVSAETSRRVRNAGTAPLVVLALELPPANGQDSTATLSTGI